MDFTAVVYFAAIAVAAAAAPAANQTGQDDVSPIHSSMHFSETLDASE